jgi:hypothetical protein
MPVRSADRTLAAAVKATVAALDAPETDRALTSLAEVLAETIDAMGPGERVTLLPQHAGQLGRVLAELEARAAKRRIPAPPAAGTAPANPVDDLRRAHARRVARGGRAG